MDVPPFEFAASARPSRLLVVCDHASARMPRDYNDLGVDPVHRYSHIAWDPGAAEVARGLAQRLDGAVILGGASRLLVDCNRAQHDPDWMAAVSCGIEVPGNRSIKDPERERRRRTWYEPYHRAIAKHLAWVRAAGAVPVVVAVHSFTPKLGASTRPWHVGVLWNRDQRLARPVLDGLGRHGGLVVGDNQPYSAQTFNHTLDTHAGLHGFPHISFEIRHDLLARGAGVKVWIDMLCAILGPLLGDEGLYQIEKTLPCA